MSEPDNSVWPYFPAFLKLRGKAVLVVGAGEIALRKVRLLEKAGATIHLVGREVHPDLLNYPLHSEYSVELLSEKKLVVAATDNPELNAEVASDAAARGIWCNVVDDAENSEFITPAIVDRSPVLFAISSSGTAPVLVRKIRETLEAQYPATLGKLATFIGGQRARINALYSGSTPRRIWEWFLNSPGAEKALQGDTAAAQSELESFDVERVAGEVYLVGAGPGDPDLLTVKALRLMQQCDVVLFDALCSQDILDRVRRDAERINVGKRRAKHTLPQEDINKLLVRLAKQGKRVLRLKGGDPFVFGRGGEEIAELQKEGIPFQVVPGVTAANSGSTYAGIPLTHRDYAQSVTFVTGHPKKDGSLSLNWQFLAQPRQTVVVYMGLGTLTEISKSLIAHGAPLSRPIAVIENASLPTQRVFCSTLEDVSEDISDETISGPTLLIIGDVVELRDSLNWHM